MNIPAELNIPIMDSPYIRYAGPGQRIPVVSLAALRSRDEVKKRELAMALGGVCRKFGYFCVEEHGIPDDLLHSAQEAVQAFFDLPHAEKMSIALSRSPYHRGYVPPGEETAYGSTVQDIKEAFDMAMNWAPTIPMCVPESSSTGPMPGRRRSRCCGPRCRGSTASGSRCAATSANCSRSRSACPTPTSPSARSSRSRNCVPRAIRSSPRAATRRRSAAASTRTTAFSR